MAQQQSKALPRRQMIEQERGREAWEDIQAVKDTANDYRTLARGLNSMIQVNGLGQTLGFFYAKSIDSKTGKPDRKKAHYQILDHLTRWMREKDHFSAANKAKMGTEYSGLLSWILDVGTTSTDYRRATTECLAFGRWLGRFAEAELVDNPTAGSVTERADNG